MVSCLISICSDILNLAYHRNKLYETLEYWSRDMLNFDFFRKGSGNSISIAFRVWSYKKILLKLCSNNWPNFIAWLFLLLEKGFQLPKIVSYLRVRFNTVVLHFLKSLKVNCLTPKRLACGFLKDVFSKERVKPSSFVTFNLILRHIFPENFIEFPQVGQKIWENSFINFFDYLTLPCYKETNESAYNRWSQHFFTFNIL